MSSSHQLTARGLCVTTPTERLLFDDLHLHVGAGERVAIVGRNGCGKTTLLSVLAGELDPTCGSVACHGQRLFVPQSHVSRQSKSPGEHRRADLEDAFSRRPDFLLLDEPTLDLDETNSKWLEGALDRFTGGCLVVSHDRHLLRLFTDFFVLSEAGCQHHHGSLESLLQTLSAQQAQRELKYSREVNQHLEKEAEHLRIARRRERKGNVGRVRELERRSARAVLNLKRSSAQESQARRANLQESRLQTARQ